MLQLKRFLAIVLVTFGVMSIAVPQAQAAAGSGGLCTVLGDYSQAATRLTLVCSGSPEMAGIWNVDLIDGVARGTSTDGRTLDGSYVEVRHCTIQITVNVTVCIYINARVCVYPYACVWVRIYVCITIRANICIGVSGRGEGQGVWARDAVA